MAETAFAATDMPLVLSLEMHCCLEQQHMIAESLIRRLGPMLLTHDELLAMGDPASLPVSALKGRVLCKGKEKGGRGGTR